MGTCECAEIIIIFLLVWNGTRDWIAACQVHYSNCHLDGLLVCAGRTTDAAAFFWRCVVFASISCDDGAYVLPPSVFWEIIVCSGITRRRSSGGTYYYYYGE